MKNTVYSVARNSNAASMEDYANELIDYILLSRNPQVTCAEVVIESVLWKRLTVDGKPFPTAFMRGSDERQTATVSRHQGKPFTITAASNDLTVLKTANSAFVGYIKDSLTTLPETHRPHLLLPRSRPSGPTRPQPSTPASTSPRSAPTCARP